MFPYPRRKELNVILFTSIFSTDKSLTEITLKMSFILRTLTIFRVSKLFWIDDLRNKYIKRVIIDIINYALKPPYLKKEIKIRKTLSKVGLLNPINIPSHIVEKEAIEGEYRIGSKGFFGLESKINTKSNVILIVNSNPVRIKEYNFYPYYNGFKFYFLNKNNILGKFENLLIASRSGKDPIKYSSEIKDMYEKKGITLIIGPPSGGLLKQLSDYIHVYNFLPNQGVKDIRVEEALISSLSILNFILG
ncbi:hypothetical protein Stok01_02891 [Sulfurisphaera tokodaii]|nr:putative RNA uridine N3 methyltransferase [Sulfurisphaera tokodaii]HII74882.1 hypothetical protein [Sulfurisphaera tokodaii]